MELFPVIIIVLAVLLFLGLIIFLVIYFYPSKLPGSCLNDNECESGYVCSLNVCRASAGTPCTVASDCLSSLNCVNKVCTEVPYTPPQPPADTILPLIIPRERDDTGEEALGIVGFKDGPFNVASEPSTPPPAQPKPPVSPAPEEVIHTEGPKVIDMTSYSSYQFFLLDNQQIIRRAADGSRTTVQSSLPLTRLFCFQHQLYALVAAKLMSLQRESFEEDEWYWNSVTWAPNNLLHVSTTLDQNYLLLQTSPHQGYLYSAPGVVLATPELQGFRRYGSDLQHYLDLDIQTHTLYAEDRVIQAVRDAALDYRNKIHLLLDSDQRYRQLAILGWEVRYVN